MIPHAFKLWATGMQCNIIVRPADIFNNLSPCYENQFPLNPVPFGSLSTVRGVAMELGFKYGVFWVQLSSRVAWAEERIQQRSGAILITYHRGRPFRLG